METFLAKCIAHKSLTCLLPHNFLVLKTKKAICGQYLSPSLSLLTLLIRLTYVFDGHSQSLNGKCAVFILFCQSSAYGRFDFRHIVGAKFLHMEGAIIPAEETNKIMPQFDETDRLFTFVK